MPYKIIISRGTCKTPSFPCIRQEQALRRQESINQRLTVNKYGFPLKECGNDGDLQVPPYIVIEIDINTSFLSLPVKQGLNSIKPRRYEPLHSIVFPDHSYVQFLPELKK